MNEPAARPRRDRQFERLYAAAVFYRAVSLALLAIVIIEAGAITWLSTRSRSARAIRLDGQVACFVRNERAAQEVHERLLAQLKGDLPGAAVLDQKWESLNWPLDRDDKVIGVADAVAALKGKVAVRVAAAAIELGGTALVTLADKEAAQSTLDLLQKEYSSGPGKLIRTDLLKADSIKIADVKVAPKEVLRDPREAIARLKAPQTLRYVVQAGDSWRRVADRYGMAVADLRALNPSQERTLRAHDVLLVKVPKPTLTVVTLMEETREETYTAAPERVETASLPSGVTRSVSKPAPGKKTITEAVEYHNGREVSRRRVNEVVTAAAAPERIMVGTANSASSDQGSSPGP
jgi:LysM repeat protein